MREDIMRAVVVSEFGGPGQLRLTDVPDPVPGPGQVRIRVTAAGVNPVDAGNRADGSWAGLRVPCILGYDVAGVVDSLGSGVAELSVGERVMAMTHLRRRRRIRRVRGRGRWTGCPDRC
jgi:NADPH2:quinone reductase